MCLKPNYLKIVFSLKAFNLNWNTIFTIQNHYTNTCSKKFFLKRGSNIFSVSLSHSIYSFKITSSVFRDNYVHSSLDWETYPLNETRCFKHKIGIFKNLLLSLIAQGTWRQMQVASCFDENYEIWWNTFHNWKYEHKEIYHFTW